LVQGYLVIYQETWTVSKNVHRCFSNFGNLDLSSHSHILLATILVSTKKGHFFSAICMYLLGSQLRKWSRFACANYKYDWQHKWIVC